MLKARGFVALALALAACGQPPATSRSAQPPRAEAESAWPADWPLRDRTRVVAGERAIVASNNTLASEAGMAMLRRGGNAVDAAVATGFALAVTHPEAGNLGGGGFMLVRLVSRREGRRASAAVGVATAALDFRETAPRAATPDMYATASGERSDDASIGYRAVAVPGSVAGFAEASRRFGSLPLSVVLEPAVELADKGFIVDSLLARSLLENRGKIARFGGANVFLPNGRVLRVGDTLRQPALARTLRRIARNGPRVFYSGTVAAELAADIRNGGGMITTRDLESYRPVWRSPLTVTYRGYAMTGLPLPSSGVLTAGETLAILEASGAAPPAGTAASVHRYASALQRAFADRSQLGDPSTTDSRAVARMLDRRRAAALAATIDPARAVPTRALPRVARREGPETTHWSVVDQQGNAVAATVTINDHFGSGAYVRSLGFFLNDTMDDFATGGPNVWGDVSSAANSIAGGKRPLSSMTPLMLFDANRQLVLVAGARGGPRIISAMVQVVSNLIDHHMTLADAVSAPRIHHQGEPDELRYDRGGFRAEVLDSLRAMGYRLTPIKPDALPYNGRVVAARRTPTGWQAVVDPRFGALAVAR